MSEKRPRSFRLDNKTHRFLDESGYDVDDLRTYLENERVRYSAGLCAECGKIAYVGGTGGAGHTVTTGGTPMGQMHDLEPHEEIDLCATHGDGEYVEMLVNNECGAYPLTCLRDEIGEYLMYRAERDAIADAQPESEWAVLITHRDTLTDADRKKAVQSWARKTNLDERYRNTNVSLTDIREAVQNFSTTPATF